MENCLFLNQQNQMLIDSLKALRLKYTKHNQSLLVQISIFSFDPFKQLFPNYDIIKINKWQLDPTQILQIFVNQQNIKEFNQIFNLSSDVVYKVVQKEITTFYVYTNVLKNLYLPYNQELNNIMNSLLHFVDQSKLIFVKSIRKDLIQLYNLTPAMNLQNIFQPFVQNNTIMLNFLGQKPLEQLKIFFKALIVEEIKFTIILQNKNLIADLQNNANILKDKRSKQYQDLSVIINDNVNDFGIKLFIEQCNQDIIFQYLQEQFSGQILLKQPIAPQQQQYNSDLDYQNNNTSVSDSLFIEDVPQVEKQGSSVKHIQLNISECISIATSILQKKRRLIFVKNLNINQLESWQWYKSQKFIFAKDGILFNVSNNDSYIFMNKGIKCIDDITVEYI